LVCNKDYLNNLLNSLCLNPLSGSIGL